MLLDWLFINVSIFVPRCSFCEVSYAWAKWRERVNNLQHNAGISSLSAQTRKRYRAGCRRVQTILFYRLHIFLHHLSNTIQGLSTPVLSRIQSQCQATDSLSISISYYRSSTNSNHFSGCRPLLIRFHQKQFEDYMSALKLNAVSKPVSNLRLAREHWPPITSS